MKQGILDKLEGLSARLEELDRTLASGEATRDLDHYRKLTREHAELGPVVALYADWRRVQNDLRAAQEILDDAASDDPDMKALAAEEVAAAQARLPEIEQELQKLLLPKDDDDERNVFLEIRAGTGGDESALFAGSLFRMYARYAERRRSFLPAKPSWADTRKSSPVLRAMAFMPASSSIGWAPRAARAGNRVTGAYPYLGLHGGDHAGGR